MTSPNISSKILVSRQSNSLLGILIATGLISALLFAPFLGNFIYKVSADDAAYGWAVKFGAAGFDFGQAIDVDTDGNVYLAGRFSNTVDFDPGAGTSNLVSAGAGDVAIVKLDASGALVWAKRIGGTSGDEVYGLAIDDSGNVYTTGGFQGTVDFDPGAGTSNLVSAGSYDIFVSKLDSSGNYVSAQRMGGTGEEYGTALYISNDAVFASGWFAGTADFDPGVGTSNLVSAGSDDAFIVKLDLSGTLVWAKRIGGTGADYGGPMALDSESNFYMSGTFNSTVDFDPGVGTNNIASAGGYDGYVLKLDENGDFVWVKTWGGTGAFEGPSSLVMDSNEDIYLGGNFTDTTDFDPGAGISNLTSLDAQDAFLLKLNSDGEFVWVKQIEGTSGQYGYSVAVDPNNDVYLTGEFYETPDFDPGSGDFELTSATADNADVFIVKLDSNGEFSWAKSIGSTGYDASSYWGRGIVVDDDYNVYTTGQFEGTVDFDPGVGTSNLVSGGNSDMFVSKLTQALSGAVADPTVSLINTEGATLTSNITSIGNDAPTERGFQYGLTDSYGSTLSETGTFSTGSYSLQLTGLTCGTQYYIRSYVTNDGGTATSDGITFTTTQCSSSGSSGGGGSQSGSEADEDPIEYCPGQTDPSACSGPTPSTPGIGSNEPLQPVRTVYNFLRNLGFGSVGEDVKLLQKFLNSNGFGLAPTGAGSLGNETTYYGPRTQNAVTRFQEYYKDQILTPLNLNNGTGYFGNQTREFINSWFK